MNRSILIVICDFLLVSLLAFSTVDIDKIANPGAQREMNVTIVPSPAKSQQQDLGNVMRQALDEERKSRDALLGELSRTRETATKQQTLLGEREKQVQTFQQELQTREQQAQQLQQQQTALQQQFAAAQTNVLTLNQKLAAATKEVILSKEERAVLEADARKQQEQLEALQRQLAKLEKYNQLTLAEKQQLAGRLQVAEVERRSAAEQAARMQEEVKLEREEKAKLAEGVKALATRSGQLAQEIRENRALAPNTIFNEFVSNRVQVRFSATRPIIFGIESNRRRETETMLVTDGVKTFALCHVQDTPLVFSEPGMEWPGLAGSLTRNAASFALPSLSFSQTDPRVVMMPVTESQIRELGSKVYRISADPYKFQEAVVVGAKAGYYGECKFQIDLTTPKYLKMDRNSLKGLFGKFNPSSGDLVFSKTGEFLGVMANGTYCMMVQNFNAAATLRFGPDVTDQRTGQVLSQFYSYVLELPFKLQ